jgi:hypothetical protein
MQPDSIHKSAAADPTKFYTADSVNAAVNGASRAATAEAPTSPQFRGTGPYGTPKVIGHLVAHDHPDPAHPSTEQKPPEHYWYDRPLGALQAAGGLGEMAVGGALLAAPEPTGLTKVGGAIVGLHGIDDLQAGVRTAITGNPTQSATQQVVTSAALALGAKPGAATALGAVVDGGLGTANPEGEAVNVVRGAIELGDAERAAQNAAKLEHGATPELTTTEKANVSRLAEQGWSTQDATIITRSQSILQSPQFQKLKDAFASGTEKKTEINGVTIMYHPELPPKYSGMTLFGDHGFLMGPAAFKSQTETGATVLQEMYRLTTSEIGPAGHAKVGGVAEETKTAQDWANRAVSALQPK